MAVFRSGENGKSNATASMNNSGCRNRPSNLQDTIQPSPRVSSAVKILSPRKGVAEMALGHPTKNAVGAIFAAAFDL